MSILDFSYFDNSQNYAILKLIYGTTLVILKQLTSVLSSRWKNNNNTRFV